MGQRTKQPIVSLSYFISQAQPFLQQAERLLPRQGPGDKPFYPEWWMTLLIMVAIFYKKKSKSAQYRFLLGRQHELLAVWGGKRFPARSGYFRRYHRAHQLYQIAIRLQGEQAIAEGVAHAKRVAVDKSMVEARGRVWHQRDRARGKIPSGVDVAATWSYSEHDQWVFGFSYEVVATATPGSVVFPLLASVDTASASEMSTFAAKINELPEAVRTVCADSAYDGNLLAERVEYDSQDRRTGRRFLCPENPRHPRPQNKPSHATASQIERRKRRQARRDFLKKPYGRRLYARRRKTVEPFNQWFKSLFDLEDRVWHRGLDNNRTQILASLFGYQLMVRVNHQLGYQHGRIRWLLDGL